MQCMSPLMPSPIAQVLVCRHTVRWNICVCTVADVPVVLQGSLELPPCTPKCVTGLPWDDPAVGRPVVELLDCIANLA
jgi:hypothetical protein